MVIDSTFWVAISFIIFFGGLVYLKVPKKINEILEKLISDKNKTKCNSQRDTKEIHNGKELKI